MTTARPGRRGTRTARDAGQPSVTAPVGGTETAAAPRVLLVGMEWHGQDPGGLNRYAADLTGALGELGVAVEAVVIGAPDPDRNFIGVARYGASLPRRLAAMGAEGRARARAADVIDTHFALYALPVLAGAPRRPHVVHFQGPWHLEAMMESGPARTVTALRRGIESFVYRRADEAVVLSEEFRQVLIDEFGMFPSKVHVIPPGVDLERFRPRDRVEARRALGLPADGLVALSVRRMAKRMGLEVLLRAWAQAQPAGARLYLVGDGHDRSRLEALAAQLGLSSRIRFVGRVPDDELPLWFAAADFSVVPSVALEGFGLVVLESLACGTPVLASDTGGMASALGDFSPGLLSPPGDIAALGQLLATVVQDPGVLPGREQCRRYSEKFSWLAVAARVVDVYQQARSRPPQRPYRVVFVDHCARLSGGELALLRLLQGAPGIDPHVILGEYGPLFERLIDAGISCEVLPLSPRASNVRRDEVLRRSSLWYGIRDTAAYIVRLARRLRQLRPDVVHTNSLKSGIYGSVAARLAGAPAVWHLHDILDDDAYPRPLGALLRRMAATLPDAVIANSAATAGVLGRTKAPVHVVPCPVDLRPGPFRSEGPPVIGIIGRLAPWKGQHVFIDALARLTGGHPGLRGRIVGSALFGEEDYTGCLRRQAAELGIAERVDFVGFQDDIAAELAQLTVAVHASTRAEPFGQVVVEAMACGVPVVAAAAGGPAETVTDGVDGLLVAPGDAAALASAIERILADPGFRTELAHAGRLSARRYRPESVAAQIEDVYREVLARRRRAGD